MVKTTSTGKKRELEKELRRWYGNLGPMDNWTIGQVENLLAAAREHQSYFHDTYERVVHLNIIDPGPADAIEKGKSENDH